MKVLILVVATALLPSLTKGQTCPVVGPKCAGNRISCTKLDEDGCLEITCKEKQKKKNKSSGRGKVQCAIKCPLECSEERNEIPCSQQQAFPRDVCDDNVWCERAIPGCTPYCPKECGKGEMLCGGRIGLDGCKSEPTCQKKPWHFCPAHCNDCPNGYRSCFKGYDTNTNCGLGWDCILEVDPVTGCENHCEPICGNHQFMCQGYSFGKNGCKTPPFCVHKTPNCPDICPIHCGPDELSCHRFDTDTDCPLQPKCIPQFYKSGIKGLMCPNYCEPHCSKDEKKCLGQHDSQGCPTPPMCIAKTIMKNGQECPNHCPMPCSPVDEIFCPMGTDMDGCDLPGTCVKQEHSHDRMCPRFCPAICDKMTTIACGPDFDLHGCPIPRTCIPKVTDVDGCDPDKCPEICLPNQRTCLNENANCPANEITCVSIEEICPEGTIDISMTGLPSTP